MFNKKLYLSDLYLCRLSYVKNKKMISEYEYVVELEGVTFAICTLQNGEFKHVLSKNKYTTEAKDDKSIHVSYHRELLKYLNDDSGFNVPNQKINLNKIKRLESYINNNSLKFTDEKENTL